MRTKQRNNLAETARHERVAQNTDVYAVKARNYKGLRRGSPVLCRNNWHIHHAKSGGGQTHSLTMSDIFTNSNPNLVSGLSEPNLSIASL